MNKIILTIAVISVSTITGCVSHGRDFDMSKASQIQKGVTTEADLVQLFGQPARRGLNEKEEVTLAWFYVTSEGFLQTKEKGLLVDLDSGGKVLKFKSIGN